MTVIVIFLSVVILFNLLIVLDLISLARQNFQSGNSYLDPKRFDECLYYLHTYGSPSSLVAFYVRHGHLKLACRYIIDQVRIYYLFSLRAMVIFSCSKGLVTRGSCIADYFLSLTMTWIGESLEHRLNYSCFEKGYP